jgi:hypothetical protein
MKNVMVMQEMTAETAPGAPPSDLLRVCGWAHGGLVGVDAADHVCRVG